MKTTRRTNRSRVALELLESRRLFSGTAATWTGAVNDSWSNSGNWQGNMLPGAGQDVVFPVGGSLDDVVLSSPETIGSLTLGYTALSGADLTIDGNITGDATHFGAILDPITLGNNLTVTVPHSLVLGGAIGDGGHDFGIAFNGGGEVDMGGYTETNGSISLPFQALPITSTYTGTTSLDNVELKTDEVLASLVQADDNGFIVGGPSIGGFAGVDAEIDPYDLSYGTEGTTTLADGLSLDANSNFGMSIDSATNYRSAIVQSGTIDITNATLFDYSAAPLTLPTSTIIPLIQNNTGHAVVGTFVGLPQDAVVTLAGAPYVINYHGGSSGQDVTLTAGQAATIALSSSQVNSIAGDNVTFTATVGGSDGNGHTPDGTVQFYDSTTPIGSPEAVTNGTATLNTDDLTAGSHTINAVYSGDTVFATNNAAFAGDTVTETIKPAVQFTSSTDHLTTRTRFATLSADAIVNRSNGGAISYRWELIVSPAGAKVPLQPPTTASSNDEMYTRFYKDGGYTFRVTASDAVDDSQTTTVHVDVEQTPTALRVTPHRVRIQPDQSQHYSVVVLDQFNHAMRTTSAADFSIPTDNGTIIDSGLFTAGENLGRVQIAVEVDDLTATIAATIV